MVGTIEINGTGGILEGGLDDAIINVNTDPVYGNFNGTTSMLSSTGADFDNIFDTNGGCVAAWIYPKGLGEGGRIFDKNVWTLYLSAESGTNAKLVFYHDFGTNHFDFSDDGHSIPYNAWSHVAVTYDADSASNNAILYVNGVAIAQTETATGSGTRADDASDTFAIGNRAATDRTFDGYIVDAKVYKNVAVTATNVAKMASKINVDKDAPDMPTSGIQLWAKLNASTTADSSGESNTLTAANMGSIVYDAFSVNVQDDTTTDGAVTVTQGKLEGLSQSYYDFSKDDDEVIQLASTIAMGTTHTLSCWFKHEGDGLQTYFGWGSGAYFDIQNTLDDFVYRVGSQSCTIDISDTHGAALSENVWYHIVAVRDGTTVSFYLNGVKLGSNTNGSMTGTDSLETLGGESGSDTSYTIDGKGRDFRMYDEALSDDQVASLYSNSLNVTPLHWWKCDEVAGNNTTVYDTGTATAVNGTLGDTDGGPNVPASGQYTLDLDSTLTIAANGTLSAPRGTLDITGAFTNSGTFSHNSGLTHLQHGTSTYVYNDGGATDTTFNNLTVTGTGGAYRFDDNFTVESTFTVASTRLMLGCDSGGGHSDMTATIGTTTSAGAVTINAGKEIEFYGNGSSTYSELKGASSLYPAVVTVPDTGALDWGSGLQCRIANLDFQGNIVTNSNSELIKLTGDCEFDAVTVSSGDTLDLNGQRAVFSGQVDPVGTLNMTNSLVYMGNRFGGSGGGTVTESGSTVVFENSGSLTNLGDSNGVDFNNCFINNSSGTMDFINDWDCSGFLKIGAGTFKAEDSNEGSNNINAQDLTIATGGTLTMESTTATCSGDFTTSGGLLGPSCLTLNGSSEYAAQTTPVSFLIEDEFTIEFWSKLDSGHTGNAYIFDLHYSGGGDDNHNRILINQDSDDIKFAVHDSSGSGTELETVGFGLNDGKWHHIAVTHSLSSSLMQLYVDGKLRQTQASTRNRVVETMRLTIGSDKGLSGAFFQGSIEELRIFQDVRTEAEIRTNMFVNVHGDISGDNLVARYGFNEGTGTAIDNSQGTAGRDLVLSDAGGWAGAGTFTEGTSTLVFTGSGKTWTMGSYLGGGTQINNMTVNAPLTLKSIDNGYGAVYMTTAGTFTLGASGTLTSTDTETLYFATANSTINVSANTDGLAALEALRFRHSSGNINLPELTTKSIKCEVSGGTVTSTGDNTITTELEVNSGATFNANGNTIAALVVDGNGSGTLDLRNSILNFSVATSGDYIMLDDTFNLLTGNTEINGDGSANKTSFYAPSDGGFEVVGDVTYLKVMSQHAAQAGDLTVIGAVSNCEAGGGDSTVGNFIRQWHHTLDTQQLLDADSGGDDDLRLTKPALDNSHELMTG